MADYITVYKNYQNRLQTIAGSFPFFNNVQVNLCGVVNTVNKPELQIPPDELDGQSFFVSENGVYVSTLNSVIFDEYQIDIDQSAFDPNLSGYLTYSIIAELTPELNSSYDKKITQQIFSPVVVAVAPRTIDRNYVVPAYVPTNIPSIQNYILPFNATIYLVGGGSAGTSTSGGNGGGYSGSTLTLNTATSYMISVGANGTTTNFNGGDSSFNGQLFAYGATVSNYGAGNIINGSLAINTLGGKSGSGDGYGNGGNIRSNGTSGYVKIIYTGPKAADGGTYSYDGTNSTHLFTTPGSFEFNTF